MIGHVGARVCLVIGSMFVIGGEGERGSAVKVNVGRRWCCERVFAVLLWKRGREGGKKKNSLKGNFFFILFTYL